MSTSRDKESLEMQSNCMEEGSRDTENCDTRIVVAAHRLAVEFTEEANLPTRFRKSTSSAQSRVLKTDSLAEQRFRENVVLWTRLIETMLSKINDRQAWRFIDQSPEVNPATRELTYCKDFCDFVDYLILRRDKENCGDEELGGLAMMSTRLQRAIEKKIQSLQAGKIEEPANEGDVY